MKIEIIPKKGEILVGEEQYIESGLEKTGEPSLHICLDKKDKSGEELFINVYFKDKEEITKFILDLTDILLEKDIEDYKSFIGQLINKLEYKYKTEIDNLQQEKRVKGLNKKKIEKLKKKKYREEILGK